MAASIMEIGRMNIVKRVKLEHLIVGTLLAYITVHLLEEGIFLPSGRSGDCWVRRALYRRLMYPFRIWAKCGVIDKSPRG